MKNAKKSDFSKKIPRHFQKSELLVQSPNFLTKLQNFRKPDSYLFEKFEKIMS